MSFLLTFSGGTSRTYKEAVRTASNSLENVNLAIAPAMIGGVNLNPKDRVLLTQQAIASQNGIYVFSSVGAPLVRAADANNNKEFTPGMLVPVAEGTYADKIFELATDGAITLGTTALNFQLALLPINLTTDVTGVLPVANGGTNRSSWTQGRIVFADVSGTALTEDSGLNWDNSNKRLGVGTSSPNAKLQVNNSGTQLGLSVYSTSSNNTAELYNQGTTSYTLALNSAANSAQTGASIGGYFARGTLSSRTQTLANDSLLSISASGHTGSAVAGISAAVVLAADQNTSASAYGGQIVFATTPNSTPSGFPIPRMYIKNDGKVNVPGLIASQFVGTDASKNLQSLSSSQATAALDAFVGDSGAGGTKGLVPAPAAGDALSGKYLKADGSWSSVVTLPSQTSNTDKVLYTNGTSAEWQYAGLGSSGSYPTNSIILGKAKPAGFTSQQSIILGTGTTGNVSTGLNNILIGHNTGADLTTGYENIFIGGSVGSAGGVATGVRNVFVGYETAKTSAVSGSNNTSIGYRAGFDLSAGTYNVCLGSDAGLYLSSGIGNVLIGHLAGLHNYGNNYNTLIGHRAGIANGLGSSNTIIGNIDGTAGLANTVIVAAGSAERFRVDSSGNMGIGTTSPAQRLDVNGGTQLRGNLIFDLDNSYTIGIDGANRPAGIHAANHITAPTIRGRDNVNGGGQHDITVRAGNGLTGNKDGGNLTLAGGLGVGTGVDGEIAVQVAGSEIARFEKESVLKLSGGLKVKSLHNQVGTLDIITVGLNDYYVGVDCSSAISGIRVDLPLASDAGAGKIYVIKDESGDATTNNISVYPSGTNKIDGLASAEVLAVDHESITLVCNGVDGWFII